MNPESTISEVKDSIAKTAVTNGTYTFTPATRSIFAPENLDPVVKLMVPTDCPVRNLLPRSKGYGQASAWKKLTKQIAKTTISGVGTNDTGTGTTGFFADAGTPSSTTQTFVVTTAAYKNIGRDVEVGRQAIASSRGYQDVRDELVQIKTLEVMLLEEDAILNGAVSATDFDGLSASITTNTGTIAGNLLTASGIGNVCLDDYWVWGAEAQVLVANPKQVKNLGDDLQGTGSIQRIVVDDQGRAIGGMALAKVVNPINGTLIDVVASRYSAANGYLLQVKSQAGESYLEMEDLESLSVYEPPVSTHSVVSRVFETTVLKNIGEVKQRLITGLTATL